MEKQLRFFSFRILLSHHIQSRILKLHSIHCKSFGSQQSHPAAIDRSFWLSSVQLMTEHLILSILYRLCIYIYMYM